MNTSLILNDFECEVAIGVTPHERAQKQSIRVDIDLQFKTPPTGCVSDELNDTICYFNLAKSIQTFVNEKQFQLIEFFAHQLYHHIKQQLSQEACLKIKIKKRPVDMNKLGLKGDVVFAYEDKSW